ncbi:biotin synthase BioB [Anaerobiospirillum thomasii]|uniref:Biotin synthase n=1 Tax=Anaerobiospirillum thomasii TaxID=179995 RepID=A0A2X0VH51_9GAMM|nr:biotin synthase BioB [Anaerobiospirillum thomasii]SPT68808.1 Biotin synthase [Anaerobiospirillum thomasii]
MSIEKLTQAILDGYAITKEEALALYDEPLESLKESALKIGQAFFNDRFELCSITNGKSGRCSENCKFCAQSRAFKTEVEVTNLKSTNTFMEEAQYNATRGVHRFSIVTSGRRLPKEEVDKVCLAYKAIADTYNIALCASHGLLDYEDFVKLKHSGVTRIHNNLETSRNFFKNVCTTHTYDQKIEAIKAAQKAGLDVCSGGIIGMGESLEDRVDMALDLRELGIVSVPVNVLNPIKGTPFEHLQRLDDTEIKKTVAIFRHILSRSVLRLAGGRILFNDITPDLYDYGINAMITGDMLTTCGLSIASDISSVIQKGRSLDIIEK